MEQMMEVIEAKHSTNAPDIIDVTPANFMAEVIEVSQTKPVIMQFWATWCEPCRQLSPILEKLVAENGKIRLARVNIDENQQIAAQMQVRSVPTIYGIVQGRPVDGFAGMQPESVCRQFVEKLAALAPEPVDIEPILAAGEAALGARDGTEALQQFQSALALSPENIEAMAGMLKAFVLMGENETAQEFYDALDETRQNAKPMQDALAVLTLAQKSHALAGQIQPLRDALTQNPENLDNYQQLALALFAGGQATQAMDILLQSIKLDPDWQEGAAKTQLFEIFSALGPTNKEVIQARRQLSTYIFS